MAHRGENTRAKLQESAEELFSLHGIGAVSDRSIAEHAGAANHSAVRYHFGGREGLIEALVMRGQEQMSSREEELLSALPQAPSPREVIAAKILPFTELLSALPAPSRHARFLFQLASLPSGRATLGATISTKQHPALMDLVPGAMEGVPALTLRSRSRVVGGMVLRVCANFEAQVEEGSQQGTWPTVAYFLIDAASGLLTAPVTRPSDFVFDDQIFSTGRLA